MQNKLCLRGGWRAYKQDNGLGGNCSTGTLPPTPPTPPPVLFECSRYVTSLLRKTCIGTCLCKPKGIIRRFLLLRKKGNGKIPRSFGFATNCSRRSVHPSSKSGPAKLPPCELHSAYQHQVSIALNCVCEHLCFISVYFVHPLARCIVR